MTKLGLLATALVGTILVSCTYSSGEFTRDKSFVTSYCIPDKIKFIEDTRYDAVFMFEGDYVSSGAYFDELCKENNDTSYNKPHGHTGPCRCLTTCITSMSVITSSDFDDNHPAGSDVSDIVKVAYQSVFDYINGGYQPLIQYDTEESYGFHNPSIYKTEATLANNINCNNTKMARSTRWVLKFTNSPSQKGIYEFHIIINTNGKELKTRFSAEFI